MRCVVGFTWADEIREVHSLQGWMVDGCEQSIFEARHGIDSWHVICRTCILNLLRSFGKEDEFLIGVFETPCQRYSARSEKVHVSNACE